MDSYRNPTADDLDVEDCEEASEVLRALGFGCDEGGHALVAVHEVLENVRARARRRCT